MSAFTGQPYAPAGASAYPVQPGAYPPAYPGSAYPGYPPSRPCEYIRTVN